ncbi:hypothetical protein JCM30760_21200 [Thiomicrorhabdus hydrogeniphila]
MFKAIEEDAAKAIGFILFEFTKLDVDLGMSIVWSNDGNNLERLTDKYTEKSFSWRLKFIKKLACEKYQYGSAELNKYMVWINRTNDVRKLRNQLVHGRWGFIPHEGCVANVVGLPTSREQRVSKYTISELNELLKNITKLRLELNELRDDCPI